MFYLFFFQECDLHRTRYEENNKLNGKLEQEISTLSDNCRDLQQNISTLEVCIYFIVKNIYIYKVLYKLIFFIIIYIFNHDFGRQNTIKICKLVFWYVAQTKLPIFKFKVQ